MKNRKKYRPAGFGSVVVLVLAMAPTSGALAAVMDSVVTGTGSFTQNTAFTGWGSGPTSTVMMAGNENPFQHASAISGDPGVFPQSGSGASGAVAHTFGENGTNSHYVFYPGNVGLSVGNYDGTWNGTARFAMDYSVNFVLDGGGIDAFSIRLELPFSGFMPENYSVAFSSSMEWVDNTTDGDPIATTVNLGDSFFFENTSPVLEDGNYGGVLSSVGTWGGFGANLNDTFTVRAYFSIQITGPGGVPMSSDASLGFYDQVAIDEGLVIPEPASLGLLLLVGGGLAMLRRIFMI